MNDLNEAVAYLARCRHIEAVKKAFLEGIEASIDENYGAALEQARKCLTTARADVADAELHLKLLALATYADTGKADKRPHPAVQIKTYTVLSYDQDAALEYCRQHLPKALKLDAREFEKAAKVLQPEFVTISEEDRATIARDLGLTELAEVSQFVETLQV